MSRPSTLGIAARLYTVVVILLLALGGVAGLAWFKLESISSAADTTGRTRVPQLDRMAAIELNITRVSLQLRHAMLSRTPAEQAATVADIEGKREDLRKLVADYDKAITTPQGRELFDKMAPALAAFWDIGAANLKLIQDGKNAEAFEFLVDKTIPARNLVLTQARAMVKYQEKGLSEGLNAIQNNANTTRNVLLAMVLLSMVGLCAFAWHITSVLRRRVAHAQAAAQRVRDGDLTQTIVDDAADEFSPLLAAMGDMQDSLARVVGTVRMGADGVATASEQIAQGNQDLNNRTEQQAGSLQQTASSMEQLSGTVTRNADNARQANQLALGASRVAQDGGAVVGEVVGTMKGINDSSRRIADIIGVIDGIAFQTNILALNAAVEAARAGEQGRGFAVVAGEVRSLAQRSAEAAREIKRLITASVEQVEQGNTLVQRAGITMREVVDSIRRVTDIMGEISIASDEQSSGVAQVGQAVTQMDQATQQNAALVEESAAAADNLRHQAQELVKAVAVFKLSPTDGHRAEVHWAV